MPQYELRLTTSAAKDLDKLSPQQRGRIEDYIEYLATQPRPHGAIKLAGRGEWRIRVGDYRVIYRIDDDARTVEIRIVRRRGIAYQQR